MNKYDAILLFADSIGIYSTGSKSSLSHDIFYTHTFRLP